MLNVSGTTRVLVAACADEFATLPANNNIATEEDRRNEPTTPKRRVAAQVDLDNFVSGTMPPTRRADRF